jgi:hypothetical protein
LIDPSGFQSVPPPTTSKLRTAISLGTLFYINPTDLLHLQSYTHYEGPHKVLEHVDNDVICVHVATRVVKKFHVKTVKNFHETPKDALKAAMIDNDQKLEATLVTR